MAPKNRIIIDTDPGVDDVLAMLLALSASPEELEVVMLSVTYGNVPLQGCLRNVVALFHVLEKEMAWRAATGRAGDAGFGALKAYKPIVAIGAEHPLEDEELMADHFHGLDGLHGVHEAHPDLTPSETWASLFAEGGEEAESSSSSASAPAPAPLPSSPYFTPSKARSHKEMLRILRDAPAGTITIVAVGPLTNVALAAAEDPEAFLRVKELVVMGGAVHVPGNITPVAEFNCYADTVAAARVYALTSPSPASTMPPLLHGRSVLPPYPARLSAAPLKLTLFPLDITTPHVLTQGAFLDGVAAAERAGSPLARWTKTFMVGAYGKMASIMGDAGRAQGFELHDPACVWYMLLRDDPRWTAVARPEDLRVETSGQWTRGMHVVDRRGGGGGSSSGKPGDASGAEQPEAAVQLAAKADLSPAVTLEAEVEAEAALGIPGDAKSWRDPGKGNRINRITGSPGEKEFAEDLMKRIFG